MRSALAILFFLSFELPVSAQGSGHISHSPNKAKSRNPVSIPAVGVIKGLSDEALLETVERQTFRFFWHGAHPVSGMALERSNTVHAEYYWDYINEAWDEPNLSHSTFGPDACATGGTGFGIMATVAAVERGWIGRDTAVGRLIRIVDFLTHADAFHGIYPHFINGRTGKAIPFDRIDDGADIVETSYLCMGLLTAKEYFKEDNVKEKYLRRRIDQIWGAANWNWHTNGTSKLFWHWSANNGFDMNFPVWGWDECLITYIMAAASPYHAIARSVYDSTWSGSGGWRNGKTYYGITLPLGNYEKGGPLFFEQYTFQGIDPRGLQDSLGVNYMDQVRNHTLINRAYCMENPKGYKGYSDKCWGLTAGDSWKGYVAHCPEVDLGVIQPTAAISSIAFTPKESMAAIRHFYEDHGKKIWSPYGFTDGFSEQHDWYAKSHLAIDQGPIVVMIENHRSNLIWSLFMNNADVQRGLKRLGFSSPYLR
jgi:hypothetical protein